MAHVQKRVRASGTTTYNVRWYTPDGKERTKGGFRTRKAAQAYATKVEHGLLTTGNGFDPAKGTTTFRAAAQAWLASRHDPKPTTRGGHEAALAPASTRQGDGKTLGIDAVFGGYPLNAITREQISEWVTRLVAAGKKPSTVRHEYFRVRMVLAQAVADGRLAANPADYVKLPSETGNPAVVDDPNQFPTAKQVSALVAATPWPYNVYVHVAAWAGLRAGELAGLQVGDVSVPPPNAPTKPGQLRVERTARVVGTTMTYLAPKTRGSRRTVPLTAATTALLRDYLAGHPHGPGSPNPNPTAPLFPAMTLTVPEPTGVKSAGPNTSMPAARQAAALAALTVAEAEARIVFDWENPLRHATFYKAVFRPAVLRANFAATATGHVGAALPPGLKFHALRHTYASLCIAAGRPPLEIARFMGHAKVTTTLGVYPHLFEDDHGDAMAALGAMGSSPVQSDNVIQLHG
jgi:integrase